EFLLRELVDPSGVRRELFLQMSRLRREQWSVDEHPCALDLGEHGDEWHLEIPVNRLQLLADDERCQLGRQLPREVRALGGELADGFRRQVLEGHSLGALPADVLFAVCAIAQMLERRLLEDVIGSVCVQQIAREYRIEIQPAERDAGPRPYERHDLEIVPAFADRLVFEQRLESTEHEIRVQLYGCGRARQQIVSLVP